MSVLNASGHYFSQGFAALVPYYYLVPLFGCVVYLPIMNFETTSSKPSAQKQSAGEAIEPEKCDARQFGGNPNGKANV